VSDAPTVSVVIPAYGHRDFITRTLESVAARTFAEPVEVIVVNDGSPDDTEAVLRPWVESGRIRYVAQANAGQGAARNRGIGMARGEFVALLDDDDLWPADKLEWSVAALRANPDAAMVYGALELIGDDDAPTVPRDALGNPVPYPCAGPDAAGPEGDAYVPFIETNWIISPGQCVVRRAALESLRPAPFDSDIWGADDWDFYLRLAEKHAFLYRPRTALRYRVHARNAGKNEVRMRRNCLKLLKKHRARQADHPERRAALDRALAFWRGQTYEHFTHLAWLDCERGEPAAGLPKLRLAAETLPRRALSRHFLGLLARCLRGRGTTTPATEGR
jgi:glycosyltransferase involved in cell wall biosynthesis